MKPKKKKIKQDSKAFEMIKNEISDTDIIYNFNYTNTIFKIADILNIQNIKDKHSFVHGSIENKNIIFGVEDKARINDEHIFLKKSSNLNFAESNIIKILNNSDEKINLVIFGHSLGITDSSYFSSYFARHTHDSNHTKMKLYYFGEDAHDEMMSILDRYTIHNLTDFKHYNDLEFIDSSS